MKRYGRYDPLIEGPQMLLAVIEAQELVLGDGLLDLSDLPDVHERSWYFAGEQRFVEGRPSSLYVWDVGTWTLDAALDREAREVAERAWRSSEISKSVWLRDRHRDQLEISVDTTLTASQFTELLTFIQALRDWPQSPLFPDTAGRPQAPVFIANEVTAQ